MRYQSPRLLTPPREDEEEYPYRPVWRTIVIETGGLFAITIGLYVIIGYLGISVSGDLNQLINGGVALVPAGLWMVFSFLRERRVLEPRRNLIAVFVISSLVANAIGIPFLNTLRTDSWLPFLGTIERVIGYAVTVGIVHEMLKYLVVRYVVWPDAFRIREDSVAYFGAAAIGYATVENLHLALAAVPSPDVIALHVFSITTTHLAASVFVAYGLAEVRFNPKAIIILPTMMLFSTLVTGIAISATSSISNAKFFLGAAATRPLFGLIIALGSVISALIVAAFLFNAAERQEREAVDSHEV